MDLLKKITTLFFFLVLTVKSVAQVELAPVLLNTNGRSSSISWGDISFSVGEPIVFTGGDSIFNFWLTQGFQQPSRFTFSILRVFASPTKVSCVGNADGKLSALVTGGVGSYTYNWSTGQSDVVIDNLIAGSYSLTITDNSGNSVTTSITLEEEQVKCGVVKIYKGFTPNNDGQNDTWKIPGIENFSSQVAIFNRWGDLVWSGTNYDNNSVVWKGENKKGQLLPDGTYFYVVNYNDKTEKGWVELTR